MYYKILHNCGIIYSSFNVVVFKFIRNIYMYMTVNPVTILQTADLVILSIHANTQIRNVILNIIINMPLCPVS